MCSLCNLNCANSGFHPTNTVFLFTLGGGMRLGFFNKVSLYHNLKNGYK